MTQCRHPLSICFQPFFCLLEKTALLVMSSSKKKQDSARGRTQGSGSLQFNMLAQQQQQGQPASNFTTPTINSSGIFVHFTRIPSSLMNSNLTPNTLFSFGRKTNNDRYGYGSRGIPSFQDFSMLTSLFWFRLHSFVRLRACRPLRFICSTYSIHWHVQLSTCSR